MDNNLVVNGTHPIAQWNTNKIPLSYRMGSIGFLIYNNH